MAKQEFAGLVGISGLVVIYKYELKCIRLTVVVAVASFISAPSK